MKYLRTFENYNKEIGNTYKEDGWMVMELDNESFNMILDRFYQDKEWIASDGDWEIYYLNSIEKDEDGEDWWHTKMAIYIDPKHYIIKTKELLSKPVYKVRDPKLSMEQELHLRSWIGKEGKPKYSRGRYLGVNDKGQAMFTSPHSGNIIYIEKDGEVITS